MALIDVIVPDLGNFKDVPVVDVLVAVGAEVEVDTPLVTLETDKASIDVPSSAAGRVVEILVAPGAKVSKGSVIVRLEASATAGGAATAATAG
ncbi:MAG: biotin/lipoyl-containing protein, partial [Steroidobacteraceae bacterium]